MRQIPDGELESLIPEIEKKAFSLLEKFICLIYEEINSSNLGSLTGSSFIAASDNIVQWMLNSNSSNIISTWFKLNSKTQNILRYSLLINGVLSNSAIDLYASSNLIKNVMQTLRRLKIIPDYKSWFFAVIIVSVSISIFGVSGAAGLTFNLYISSLTRAIIFSFTTVIVTLFTSTFFFHGQLDALRRYYLSTEDNRNEELLLLKTAFFSFARNLSNLTPEEFDFLKTQIEKFYKSKNRTHNDICNILELLRPLFRPVANQRIDNNKLSCNLTTIKYLPPIIFAAFATWLYYGVGSVSIETFIHNLNKKSPAILNALVGSCMGIIAGVTVCYSINQIIPSNICSNISHFCSQPTKHQLIMLGKAVLQLIISSLAALAVVNLVDIANSNRSSSFKQIISVFAIIQQTLVVANCILQTSPKEFLENLYMDISRLFIKNVKAEQKRATENIETLSAQMELASKNDLENLNNAFRKASFI